MYHAAAIIPDPADMHVSMHGDGQERIRTIRFGETTTGCTLHIETRAVLDALQAALDEIRADFDAAGQTADADADARDENAKTAARDWPAVLSDMAPGELVEIHGK